ncbi:MAG: hypothetical protein ABIH99_03800, partial [Candidatus Micrarchaeota archaeon]
LSFEQTILLLPIPLVILTALGFYFAVRILFSKTSALLSTLLLLVSYPFASSFASGMLSPVVFCATLFALALSFFILAITRNQLAFAVPSGLLLGLTALSAPHGWLLLILLLISAFAEVVYQMMTKREFNNIAYPLALVAVLSLPFLTQAQLAAPSNFSLETLAAMLLMLPLFIVGLASSLDMLRRVDGEFSPFVLLLALGSLILGASSPVLGVIGIALLSAYGIEMIHEKRTNSRLSLSYFALALFALTFAVFFALLDPIRALIFGIIVAGAAYFLFSLYKDRNISPYLAFAAISFTIFINLAGALLLLQVGSPMLSNEWKDALSWVEASTPENATVIALGKSEAVAFLAERNSPKMDAELAKFLLTSESPSELKKLGVDYILIESSQFDALPNLATLANLSDVQLESFRLVGYLEARNQQLYFVALGGKLEGTIARNVYLSNYGRVLQIPVQNGEFAGEDALIEQSGTVPLARLKILLTNETGASDLINDRIIYPIGGYDSNIFNMFFYGVKGIKQVYPSSNGIVRVYKVS